jgi:hypothetical protein
MYAILTTNCWPLKSILNSGKTSILRLRVKKWQHVTELKTN